MITFIFISPANNVAMKSDSNNKDDVKVLLALSFMNTKCCNLHSSLLETVPSLPFHPITFFFLGTKPSKNLSQNHPHVNHYAIRQGQWTNLANFPGTNCLVLCAVKNPQQSTWESSVLWLMLEHRLAGSSQINKKVHFESGVCLWTLPQSLALRVLVWPILLIPWLFSSEMPFSGQWSAVSGQSTKLI